MRHQSFAGWRLPRELDALLLREDRGVHARWSAAQERHFHDEIELHFVDRGRGLFLLPSGRIWVSPRTLVWIPPRRDHLLLEASDDFRRWMLLCRRRLVHRVLPRASEDLAIGRAARVRSGVLPPRLAVALSQVFEDVHAARGAQLPLVNAALGYALARAAMAFEEAAPSDEPAALHPAVAVAVRALREAGVRPTLPELSARARLSPAHLSKLFSAELGVSITDFRNRVGIERFVDVYGDGEDTTLLDAALEAGFGSYPQFHRVFRREMGYTPAEHRERVARRDIFGPSAAVADHVTARDSR
jgi:AraC-like DNA-binding protein